MNYTITTTKERELELWKRYKTGDNRALIELLESLAPLIHGQVGKFAGVGLPRVSIEMEAKRLTIQALDTYDPNFGTQLNTHITNYLKKIQRYVIKHQNVAQIPEPRAIALGRYTTIYENLESEKGREPTVSELADEMKWSPLEVERLQVEQRKDLSMTMDTDDSEGGFYYFQNPNLPTYADTQAIEFVYFDSDPIDKKIMEYSFPKFGKTITPLTKKEISQKLSLTPQEVRKRQKQLGVKIKELIE